MPTFWERSEIMNLENQLSAVLNDPEAMSKIAAIAGSLGLGGDSGGQNTPQSSPQPAPVQANDPPPQQGGLRLPDLGNDDRTKLLMSLKPFLSQKRAPYVDGAVALLRMMQLGKLGGSLFGNGNNS